MSEFVRVRSAGGPDLEYSVSVEAFNAFPDRYESVEKPARKPAAVKKPAVKKPAVKAAKKTPAAPAVGEPSGGDIKKEETK